VERDTNSSEMKAKELKELKDQPTAGPATSQLNPAAKAEALGFLARLRLPGTRVDSKADNGWVEKEKPGKYAPTGAITSTRGALGSGLGEEASFIVDFASASSGTNVFHFNVEFKFKLCIFAYFYCRVVCLVFPVCDYLFISSIFSILIYYNNNYNHNNNNDTINHHHHLRN
jgi:hypothetical protein